VVGRPGNVLRRSGGPGGRSEAVGGVQMVVDDDIVVVDGSCAAVASGDVAHVGGVDGLVGVSLGGAVCVTALAVVVDIVCALESVVTLAVGSVCISASIPTFWNRVPRSSHLSGPCFVSQLSRSAVLPLSSPSFTPFLYPASNCASLPPCSRSM
jgi:hypothetical protein